MTNQRTAAIFTKLIRGSQLIACYANTTAPYGCAADALTGEIRFRTWMKPNSGRSFEILESWIADVQLWAQRNLGTGLYTPSLPVSRHRFSSAIIVMICISGTDAVLKRDAISDGYDLTPECKRNWNTGLQLIETSRIETAAAEGK
jgi:hypothetical protein